MRELIKINNISNDVNKDEKKGAKKSDTKKEIKEYIITIAIAVVVALVFRTYVFARNNVDGQSMMSTLKNADVVFTERISIYANSIKRGEIITFDSKNEKNDIFIKRVIALAGDEIEVKAGKVYLNGNELKEDYLDPNTFTKSATFLKEGEKYKVPEGSVFVLGDNRPVSLDSRYLGPIKITDIKGHVVVRAYPFNSIKTF